MEEGEGQYQQQSNGWKRRFTTEFNRQWFTHKPTKQMLCNSVSFVFYLSFSLPSRLPFMSALIHAVQMSPHMPTDSPHTILYSLMHHKSSYERDTSHTERGREREKEKLCLFHFPRERDGGRGKEREGGGATTQTHLRKTLLPRLKR